MHAMHAVQSETDAAAPHRLHAAELKDFFRAAGRPTLLWSYQARSGVSAVADAELCLCDPKVGLLSFAAALALLCAGDHASEAQEKHSNSAGYGPQVTSQPRP